MSKKHGGGNKTGSDKKNVPDNLPLQPKHSLSPLILLGLLLVLVGSIVIIVHWPALGAQALTLDDELYLRKLASNPGWDLVQKIVTEAIQPSVVRGYYQPLSLISLVADSALGGQSTNLFAYHCTNLVLHVLNVALISIFFFLLFRNVWLAAFIGLLFGVHPLTIESIAWIVERKTLLAAFFSLLALVLYLRYTQNSAKKLLWSAWAAFMLALLSKPTSVVLPLLMLLLDWWPLKRLSWKTFWEKSFFYVSALLLGTVAFISQNLTVTIPAANTIIYEPFALLKAPLLLGYNTSFYLAKIFWPVKQTIFYPNPQPFSIINPDLWIYIIPFYLVLILMLILLRWNKSPENQAALVSWLFFVSALIPASGIIQFTYTLTADRHLYALPLLGFFLFPGWLLNQLWHKGSRVLSKELPKVIPLLVVLLVVVAGEVLATRTYLRNWKDSESLARYFLSVTPENYLIHGSLAEALYKKGKLDEAVECFKTAINLNPDYAAGYNNLGIIYSEQLKSEEAFFHFSKARWIRSGKKEPFVW
jgi:tetratricopeptide (TPR) repeat protein